MVSYLERKDSFIGCLSLEQLYTALAIPVSYSVYNTLCFLNTIINMV